MRRIIRVDGTAVVRLYLADAVAAVTGPSIAVVARLTGLIDKPITTTRRCLTRGTRTCGSNCATGKEYEPCTSILPIATNGGSISTCSGRKRTRAASWAATADKQNSD